MKYKVPRSEVFRLWATQAQDHAEEAGMKYRTFFDGNTCYSYGTHFPIARHIENGNVLFTLRTQSRTTSVHIQEARHACYRANLNVIYCLYVKGDDHIMDSISHWEAQIEQLFAEIGDPTNRKFNGRVEKLQCVAGQFRKYIECYVPTWELSFKTLTALAFIEGGDVVNLLRQK